MGIIIDIIFICILALSIYLGYKKGLVKVIFNVVAFLIAIILTVILYRPITNVVINNTELDEKIANVIIEKGTVEVENSSKNKTIDKYVENTKKNIQNDVVNTTAKSLSENLVGIIVMVSLFIILRIVLIVIAFFANSLAELPIVKQFNKVGGTIYGVLEGIIIVLAVLAIVYFISSITKDSNIVSVINTSIITKYVYYNNPILNIIF